MKIQKKSKTIKKQKTIVIKKKMPIQEKNNGDVTFKKPSKKAFKLVIMRT